MKRKEKSVLDKRDSLIREALWGPFTGFYLFIFFVTYLHFLSLKFLICKMYIFDQESSKLFSICISEKSISRNLVLSHERLAPTHQEGLITLVFWFLVFKK